jgi:Protein of unknown function (DUF1573)
MNKTFFSIAFACAMMIGAFVSCQQSNKQNPSSSTESNEADAIRELTTVQWLDTLKVLGKIYEGEKVEVTYRFKNTGNKPLVIESVRPSCGCTVADKPEKPIMPGEEGMIRAAFDSKGKPGSNNKNIMVFSNTEEKFRNLYFEVEVAPKQ